MIEKIYITRHGFRMNWATSDWKSVTGLPRDPPLTAYGVAQAEELAKYFQALPEHERPTAIFSSPYYRCLQTAQPTALALGVPIYAEHGLSEWYSPAAPGTGLHPRPAPAPVLRAHVPEIDPAWSSLWYPPRAGEDLDQVHARAAGVLAALLPALARRAPAHTRVLLVTHAATAIALARGLLGDRSLPLRVGCCSLTEVVRSAGAGAGWVPVRLAEVGHLSEGPSRDWGFEDVVINNGEVIKDRGESGTEHDVDEPLGLQLHSNL